MFSKLSDLTSSAIVLVILGMLLVLCFVPVQSAEFTLDSTTTITVCGYTGIDVPNADIADITVRWARLRAEVKHMPEHVSARFEYDFASDALTYLFIRKTVVLKTPDFSVWGDSVQFTGTLGRFVTPTALLYEGPSALKTTRWAHGFDRFGVYGLGAHATVSLEDGDIHLSYDSTGYSFAAMTDFGFGWFVEEFVGVGWVFEKQLTDLIWPQIVSTLPNDTAIDSQWSLRNYSHIADDVWVGMIVDWGETEAYHFGLTYEYAPKCFAKAYWDVSPFSHPAMTFEATFVF